MDREEFVNGDPGDITIRLTYRQAMALADALEYLPGSPLLEHLRQLLLFQGADFYQRQLLFVESCGRMEVHG